MRSSAHGLLVALGLCALAASAGCKKSAPVQPEPAPSATAAPAETAAAPIDAAPTAHVASADEEIAVPEDFEDEAAKDITDKNYKAELDKIEKELSTPEE